MWHVGWCCRVTSEYSGIEWQKCIGSQSPADKYLLIGDIYLISIQRSSSLTIGQYHSRYLLDSPNNNINTGDHKRRILHIDSKSIRGLEGKCCGFEYYRHDVFGIVDRASIEGRLY